MSNGVEVSREPSRRPSIATNSKSDSYSPSPTLERRFNRSRSQSPQVTGQSRGSIDQPGNDTKPPRRFADQSRSNSRSPLIGSGTFRPQVSNRREFSMSPRRGQAPASRSPRRAPAPGNRSPRYQRGSRSPAYRGGGGGGFLSSRSTSRSPEYQRRKIPQHLRENPPVSKCLGVFGLDLRIKEKDLYELFVRHGQIDDINLIFDSFTGRSRGFAFVYFRHTDDATSAKEALHGITVNGKPIRVDYSVTEKPHEPTPGVYLGRASTAPRRYENGRQGGGGGYYGGDSGGRYSPGPPPPSHHYSRRERPYDDRYSERFPERYTERYSDRYPDRYGDRNQDRYMERSNDRNGYWR